MECKMSQARMGTEVFTYAEECLPETELLAGFFKQPFFKLEPNCFSNYKITRITLMDHGTEVTFGGLTDEKLVGALKEAKMPDSITLDL
jgi:hypothetical protein